MEEQSHQIRSQHSVAAEIPEVNEANFGEKVLSSRLPVWVVFEAYWSTPCQLLDQLLGEIKSLCGSGACVVRVDADANPGLGIWYEVAHLPTLLWFVKGEVCERIVGISEKTELFAKIKKIMK